MTTRGPARTRCSGATWPASAEEIARLCPEPAHRVGASAPPQADAQAERFRLFESIDTWIGRIAARHPVLLVLDDLQWADQPSFFLLPHLMRARRSTPLLTVAMYRDLGPERSEFSAALPGADPRYSLSAGDAARA